MHEGIGNAARKLQKRLDEHAVAYMPQGSLHTHSDGDSVGSWLAASYTESRNDVSFWELSTGEAAELIRTFDVMQEARRRPWVRNAKERLHDADKDLVEVVRCKDCKHCDQSSNNGMMLCRLRYLSSFYTDPLGFCNRGEAR